MPSTVQQAVEAGATGYLTKQCAVDDLLKAVRQTRIGISFISRQVSQISKRLNECPNGARNGHLKMNGHSLKKPVILLSDRQIQCLRLIADGYLTREIARLLRISRKTAEKHRQSLMDKLNIHQVATLTRYAISTGVIPIEPRAKFS